MEPPKIHIALVGKEWDQVLMRSILKRSIDELIFAFDPNTPQSVHELLEGLSQFGIHATVVQFSNYNFESMLSSILEVINCRNLDGHQVEFNVSFANPMMTIVACMAAEIMHANIIYRPDEASDMVAEIRPAKLSNLTKRKKEILGYLARQPKEVLQKEITKELDIPRSGVSRQLQDLEQAGYVERIRTNRLKTVRITPLGASVIHGKMLRQRRVWASGSRSEKGYPSEHIGIKPSGTIFGDRHFPSRSEIGG